MNIQDVTIDHSQYKGKDELDVIFDKQDELRKRYFIPVANLDVPSDQSLCREFAWNVVEEMGEALEARGKDHQLDELADSLGFYIELMLICGIKSSDFGRGTFYWNAIPDTSELINSHSEFTMKLSLTINKLKNRRWRRTHVHTNQSEFRQALMFTFGFFTEFVSSMGIDSGELFDAYLKKWEVNSFRLNSNY